MNNFRFSQRSERNLVDIHPDLIKVVRRALLLSKVDFAVIEGRRTKERQQQMVNSGASQTLHSRHITGHAVDLAPWVDGTIPWKDWSAFATVADAVKRAAQELRIPIVWGGDWKTFKDGPHFELPRQDYPE